MEKLRGREVNFPRASVWCRQSQTQVFLTLKPALLSTAPTACQVERRGEGAKGRKGNTDKDTEGTLSLPRGGVCAGAGGEARQARRELLIQH